MALRRLVALSLILLPVVALADEAPLYVVQTGRLMGADDKPATGAVTLALTLFATPDENDGTWTDSFDVSPGADGTYQIVLGTNKALVASDFAGRKYLGVSIGNQKLLPRLRIGTTPFAARAADADRLGGVAATDYALKADVPTKTADSDKLGGLEAAKYALKTDIPEKAADSLKLGGVAATSLLDTNGRLLASALPVSAATLDGSGKLAPSALPILDANGKLLPSALPASVPQLDGGKLDLALLPAGVALLDGNGKLASSLLAGPLPLSLLPTGTPGTSAGLALLDSSGRIPAGALPPIAASLNQTQANVANGQCVTVNHNWNTNALGYSAWMRDPAATTNPWVPVQPGYDPGTTNLALNKPTGASADYNGSSYNQKFGNDGVVSTSGCPAANAAWLTPAGQSAGWWQVDLGSVRPISTVRLITSEPGCTGWGTTSWDIQLSQDGSSFAAAVASGACVAGASCASWQTHALPANTTARTVRFTSKTATGNGAGLWELELYSSNYTVSQPDANSVKFCNYTGLPRDMSLVVWK